ncbi:MAG TPA: LpqB family beta-propeller domain-containing protein [Actinomycetota bacterium]|nr:LpqB family beta-propeller domain-containing protein [Actinomycetota bacterium]
MGSRPVRLLRPAVALAVLLGLAACTAGVPQTGEVVTYSPVTSAAPPVDPETPQDVGGPFPGQSESDVAVGYMNAMNSGEVSRIQRWVMPGADREQVAAWSKETTTVQVYSVFDPGYPYDDGGRRIVPVRVKLVGQLRGGRDWYPATGDHMLKIEVGRDGADARVANPGLVMWMRDVNFSMLYTPAEVYMTPDRNDPTPQVAPVPVFVPKGAEGDPDAPELRVRRALELLLAGPRDRYANLETAIPPGTKVLGFQYAKDVATVNLSRRFTQPDGSGQLRVGQVVWTVNRLLPNASVRLLVEKDAVKTVGDDLFPTMRRLRRKDPLLAAMWPQRSQEHGGDSILFVRRGEIFTIAPEPGQQPKLVDVTAQSPKSAPTWSPDHRHMAFLSGSGRTQNLWVRQPSGAADKVEGLSGRLSAPSWSPDSKRIYVVSRSDAGSRLEEVNRDTLGVRTLELPPLPAGLQLASVAVSPDGAFVLAVADRPSRPVEDADPVPGGQLFLGQFGPDGIVDWSGRPIAPGLGRVFSPVWVDPVTVAFIAETSNKDDLGKLWTIKSDGWDPTAVFNDSDIPIGDIGNHLAVDPAGRSFVVTARTTNGSSLWMVNRLRKSVDYLTLPTANAFDGDPSFASH